MIDLERHDLSYIKFKTAINFIKMKEFIKYRV